jgi:hypothetical protein
MCDGEDGIGRLGGADRVLLAPGSREEAAHSLPLCLIAASKPYGT